MPRYHNKRLELVHFLQILLYQLILHPVLAYLAVGAVGHQFIREQGDFMVKIIIYHELNCPAFQASLVIIHGLGGNLAFWPVAVAIYPPTGEQLLQELPGQLWL